MDVLILTENDQTLQSLLTLFSSFVVVLVLQTVTLLLYYLALALLALARAVYRHTNTVQVECSVIHFDCLSYVGHPSHIII